MEEAVLAGGCFWCMEPPYDKLDGVVNTIVGYAGDVDTASPPNYESVSAGKTPFAEVIKVVFDPSKVNFETIIEVFWLNIDPLRVNGQFCDVGAQYRTAIFYTSENQRLYAEKSKAQKQVELGQAIATEISPLKAFYPAEDYHQDYYQKNPIRYKFYRYSCGRDKRLKEIWKK